MLRDPLAYLAAGLEGLTRDGPFRQLRVLRERPLEAFAAASRELGLSGRSMPA